MTNGVNFNGYGYGYYPQYAQYQQAAEYATARVVEEKTESSLSGVGVFAAIEGVTKTAKVIKTKKAPVEKAKGWDKFLNLFKKETYAAKGKSIKETGKILKDMGKEYATSVKTSVKTGVETLKTTSATDVIKNTVKKGMTSARIQAAEGAIPSAEKIAKLTSEGAKMDYELAGKWLEKAKTAKTSKIAAKYTEQAEKAIVEAKSFSSKAAAEKTVGKIATKSPTLGTTASKIATESSSLGKIATKSPTIARVGNVFKASGAGTVAIVEGGIELCTEVAPTFKKLGAKRGFKQLGKSATKVGASACGWAAGWYIGAAIGSVIPGAGTAVGAIIGGIISTVGGMICSSLARKGAEKLVGKNELELAAEEEQEQAQQAQQQQVAFQQQQMAALQQQQQALSQVSYSSNPFCSSGNIMDKDIMGVMSGYVI